MTSKSHLGFSLIELLFVMLNISILAAVALPIYQDYTLRARLSEAFSQASALKPGVISNAAEGRTDLSANATTIGATPNVTSGTVDGGSGAITIITTPRAGGGSITLTPSDGAGAPLQAGTPPAGVIQWTCSATIQQKYVPRSCSGI